MNRVLLAEGLLEAEVPENWLVRTIAMPDAKLADVATPERYAEWEPRHLPEELSTFVLRTNEPLDELAETRMRRHVGQGEPGRFADLVGAVPANGYEWTDVVRDIATWFVQPTKGVVVAIYVSLPGLLDPSRTDRDAVARGRMFLHGARWAPVRT